MMAVRHFLSLTDLSPAEAQGLMQRASELKVMQRAGEIYEPLKNKVLAMVADRVAGERKDRILQRKVASDSTCIVRQRWPPVTPSG